MAFSDWSTTADSNGTTLGVDISEGCAAANVNNGIRSVMAQLRAAFSTSLATFLAGTDPLPVANGGTGGTSLSGLTVPTGSIILFGASTPPSGWLECNGAAISRSTYADLFTAIGTTHGAGNGTTTFNLPDTRGEFIRGWDHGRGADSGRAYGSYQAEESKAHRHFTITSQLNGSIVTNTTYTSRQKTVAGDSDYELLGTSTEPTLAPTSSTGGAENRPRNLALIYCIKA